MVFINIVFTITLSAFFVLCSVSYPHGMAEELLLTEGEEIYTWYCTPCHGMRGDGKGFNAKNLDPRPIDHTDSVFMNKRSDKDLYDAISEGGRAVGKSTLMPPWGNTLNGAQIKSLILYLRKLCNCQGG